MSWVRIVGWAGLVALTGVAAIGVFAGPETLMELAPRCSFHALSGHACPTCGMTRAIAALCQGNLSGMMHHNAASPLVLLATLWGLVRLAVTPDDPETTEPPFIAPKDKQRLRAAVSGLIELTEDTAAEPVAECV